MKKRVALSTLGCRLNQSETAVLENRFDACGWSVVNFDQTADVVVINTCTVTENGDADTRRLVNRANRQNPKAHIALIGCQAQIQKNQLTALPGVKWVIGNGVKMTLPEILKQNPFPEKAIVITPTIEKKSFTQPAPAIDRNHTRANLKIQDGCDFFCSFCEIPYARGRARSREFNDVLSEAETLVQAGHREIVLTGINIGTYHYQNYTLMDIVSAMEQIRSLARIRVSSIEPTTIPGSLIKHMGDPSSKLCRYLHIPLQSGCDRTLTDMKRKYTVKEFDKFIRQAYDMVPDICIGTDVIVGYPGETEEDFLQTRLYLSDAPIHYFHIFSYSARHLAKSRNQKNISPQIIKERSRILREMSRRKRADYLLTQIDKETTVLIEQKKNDFWTGVTDNYIRVQVQSQKKLTNELIDVKLITAEQNFMQGQTINERR